MKIPVSAFLSLGEIIISYDIFFTPPGGRTIQFVIKEKGRRDPLVVQGLIDGYKVKDLLRSFGSAIPELISLYDVWEGSMVDFENIMKTGDLVEELRHNV